MSTESDFFGINSETDAGGGDDLFELEVAPKNGLQDLWALIDPIWKFSNDELVAFMAKRVIYESEDIIALDKPFQMALSSGPADQPQLDRIIQSLKKRIAPGADRLHVVTPLDKDCSGVIVFAKSRAKQLELQAQLASDAFLFRYRCLCKNIPLMQKARISIPLIKVVKGSNVKFCPLVGTASEKEQLYHLNTDFKLVNYCRKVHCSLVDAYERRGIAQLVRSHLYYGLNCSLVGDKKYVKAHIRHVDNFRPPVLDTVISPQAMLALGLRINNMRKMPMFMHRAEAHVPQGNSGDFSMIRAEVPRVFTYALKKLHLLRK